MDTSSLSSALVFFGFLLLFSYLSLAEHLGNVRGALSLQGKTPQYARPLLALRYACVVAATLSGLALVDSIKDVGWWLISILSLALLVSLAIIDRASAFIATRRPTWAVSWSGPLLQVLTRYFQRKPTNTDRSPVGNGDSSGLNGDIHPEREEPDLPEEVLVSLDQRDREMLRSILRLDFTTARDIMAPRLDVVAVDSNATLEEAAEQMAQSGHSRLPVYEETMDHVVGIVHSRDLLALLAQRKSGISLRELWRPAFFIPESKRLDDLLEELQEKGVQMAIVVDEYGGTEGLVTMEDLLEEIVGEIEDEFSRALESQVVHLPEGGVLVDAGVSTEQIEDLFSTHIDSQDVDTVGGYVYWTLGKIPQVGDVVVTDSLRIEVVSILGRRLRKLRIKRTDDAASTSAG